MILLIDNYDSFTYNLYQYIGSINSDIKAVRNDKISLNEINSLNPSHIIFSPGPSHPKDAGIMIDAIKTYADKFAMLGVCLGHQAIAYAFGGDVIKAKKLLHGKNSTINVTEDSLIYKDLPKNFKVARYHSLIADEKTLPTCLKATSYDDSGQIMSLEHKTHKVYGVQYHPESILSEHGLAIIKNFLSIS